MKDVLIFFMVIIISNLFIECTDIQSMDNLGIHTLEKRDKYLTLDTTIFSLIINAKLEIGKVEKYTDNPLFGEDNDWEVRFDNLYGNVIYDEEENLYKCWYNPFIVDLGTSKTREVERLSLDYNEAREKYGRKRESALCYAYSQDGITWVKPKYNIHFFEGEPSNILVRNSHGAGVFKDEVESDPEKRYKMFFRNHDSGDVNVAVAYSADGIHWSEPINFPNINVYADTHNNAFWAPTLKKYVAITRDWDRNNSGDIKQIRLVARTESDNFENWTDSEIIMRGLEDYLQVYSMPVFYYQGVYVGLPSILNTIDDRVHTELAWSKDTKEWFRVNPGMPFIPYGSKEGEYDWGCVYAAANPVILDDEIRLYYGGSDGLHFNWRKGNFSLARLHTDGFAGYEPKVDDKVGVLRTHKLIRDGNNLLLVANIESGGKMKVFAVQGKQRLPLDAVKKISANHQYKLSISQEVIDQLDGQEIQLEFELYKAKLYSIDFQ